MEPDQPRIDVALVRRLIAKQFPRWAKLPVVAADQAGWCNMTFRLGDEMVVRLPRHLAYAAQVEKEYEWLPRLAPLLPLPIPKPLAMGEPEDEYPWKWSIYRWIEGETARPENVVDTVTFAADLGIFLSALQGLESIGGPPPGTHCFYRGGSLQTYDAQTRKAIAVLAGRIDAAATVKVWETALASKWTEPPVWVHGDVSVGNLLVQSGKLCAVIDFGNLSVGDPACDLAISWAVFNGEASDAFRAKLPLDPATWARGRGWALWKALILAAGLTNSNAYEASRPWEVIHAVLSDHRGTEA